MKGIESYRRRCPHCDATFTIMVHPGCKATSDSPAEGPEIWAENCRDCCADLSYDELVQLIDDGTSGLPEKDYDPVEEYERGMKNEN